MIRDICALIQKRVVPSNRLSICGYNIQSFLHDILSGDIDADRMDYLLRDSHMCGVNYGLYDPNRILKSMCAYGRNDTMELHVGLRFSALGAVEDLLISRYQMHGQIYGHKTNRACNAMLDLIRKQLRKAKWKWYSSCKTMEQLLSAFSDLDDFSFNRKLREKSIDNGAGKVKEIAEELLVKRKLVKKVYEERVDLSKNKHKREHWEKQKRSFERKKILFVPDEFKNKGPSVKQKNYYLKVLKKTKDGFYKVHELKECSTVVQYLPEEEVVFRIYSKGVDFERAKKIMPD